MPTFETQQWENIPQPDPAIEQQASQLPLTPNLDQYEADLAATPSQLSPEDMGEGTRVGRVANFMGKVVAKYENFADNHKIIATGVEAAVGYAADKASDTLGKKFDKERTIPKENAKSTMGFVEAARGGLSEKIKNRAAARGLGHASLHKFVKFGIDAGVTVATRGKSQGARAKVARK
jgi:hypothetical protein